MYRCEENVCNLHPCCFNLPRKVHIDDVIFELSDEVLPADCIWCNDKRLKGSVTSNSGWSYVCKCKKYNCHSYCTTQRLLDEWKKADSNDNNYLIPENLKVPIKTQLRRNKGSGVDYTMILKIFFRVVVSIVTGDPTGILASAVLPLSSVWCCFEVSSCYVFSLSSRSCIRILHGIFSGN